MLTYLAYLAHMTKTRVVVAAVLVALTVPLTGCIPMPIQCMEFGCMY